jgi:hypothetical protein
VKSFNTPLLFLLLLGAGYCPLVEIARSQPGTVQEDQGAIKRLILTDGSYELISQYRIEGDRVRYFSTERRTWEELPCSLVDWTATRECAARASHEASEQTSDALDSAARERREEEARTPMVAPGVRLPSPEGVFLLDMYRDKPELNRLVQNGGDLNKNTGSNILRGVINPISGSKQTVELDGLHAVSSRTCPNLPFTLPSMSAIP